MTLKTPRALVSNVRHKQEGAPGFRNFWSGLTFGGPQASLLMEESLNAPDSIAVLVGRAQSGEAEAFEQLVRRYFRTAFAVALSVLRSVADAEDIAQDSFLVAFEELDRCRNPERFVGWLLRIVRNRAINALRSRRAAGTAAERLEEMGATRKQEREEVGLRDRLVSALGLLTPVQCEVILLHDLDGWTHAEIGDAMEISELMSRQHLFQAHRVMRAFLRQPDVKSEVAGGN